MRADPSTGCDQAVAPASLIAEVGQPVERSASHQRIAALDWTKGALIVLMVVYHAINYSAFRPLAFRYLAFLPPSFILITGFLVGRIYPAKYNLNSSTPYIRLVARGIKLLMIFIILNVTNCIAVERSVSEGLFEFADRSGVIFLSGNGREGIFEVLLPIAYFLLLAPVLLWLRSRARTAVAVCAMLGFVACLFMEANGHSSKNMILLSAGLIGMALGLVRMEFVDRLARMWVPGLLLYAVYRLCTYWLGEIYALQMFGATVAVFLLYGVAIHLKHDARWFQQMVIFGQYSLFGYLAQIAILQVVVRLAGGKPSQPAGVVLVGCVTAGLLLLLVRLAHWLRWRNSHADAIYRAVFA